MTDSKFSQLEKAILKTICYYDIFDYPLTNEEIWNWLYLDEAGETKSDLNSVLEALEMSRRLKEVIDDDEGYYFLKGRREIVETRRERREIAKRKMSIARYVAGYLRMAPYLKYVAVCNNLAFNNARRESDIDLLVVTEAGWLWESRFFITALVQLLGRRRYKNKVKDRICLSFFVTTEALNFEPLLLPEGDPYFNFWVSQLASLYDPDNCYQKIQEANSWALKKMPNAFKKAPVPPVKKNFFASLIQKMLSLIFLNALYGRNLSQGLRAAQYKKMERNKESLMHEYGNKVVVSDTVLKFHEADRREKYQEVFENRLKKLGLTE